MEKITPIGQRSVIIQYEDGREERVSLLGVRCGLHWPMAGTPGLYILLGQLRKSDIMGINPLRLLKEVEVQIPSELFEKLMDDLGNFNCQEIFTDTERFRDYVLDFSKFKKQNRPNQRILLKRAPFFEDFSHGVFTIRGWIKKGTLIIPPNSLTYEQLKNISMKDLKNAPEERFHAIDALRFVIGAFEVFGTPQITIQQMNQAPPIGAFV